MSAPDPSSADRRNARAEAAEERLALPVLVAALVSVPAVFLTTVGGRAAIVGTALNWASMVVLLGESVLLLWLSRDVKAWMRTHWWKVALAAATVPAVVFVVGPVQITRLVLSLSAVRVLRAGRIVRAGRVIRRKAEWAEGHRGRWLLAATIGLAAVFVAIVLIDPTSRSHRVLGWAFEHVGVLPTLLAALLLALAAALVMRDIGNGRMRARLRRYVRRWRSQR